MIAPAAILSRLWVTLIASGSSRGLLPCGLGARETLRLEAGYLLYGSDVDEEHTPLEAGYDWVVKFQKEDFIGKAALEAQKKKGLQRRLYGIRLLERGVPRPGAPVLLEDRPAGRLSSAGFSPTLGAGIGLGYLEEPGLEPKRGVSIELRGRRVPAEIAALPFYRRSR